MIGMDVLASREAVAWDLVFSKRVIQVETKNGVHYSPIIFSRSSSSKQMSKILFNDRGTDMEDEEEEEIEEPEEEDPDAAVANQLLSDTLSQPHRMEEIDVEMPPLMYPMMEPDEAEYQREVSEDIREMLKRAEDVVMSATFKQYLEETGCKLSREEVYREVCALVEEYQHVFKVDFAVSPTDELRLEVRLVLKEGAQPVYRKQYRLSHSDAQIVKETVERNVALGRMRVLEEKSPYNAVSFTVPKPRQVERRMVTDYRGVNETLLGEPYVPPDARHSVDALAQASIFGEFDVASGFWQVRINPEDQHLLATTIEGVGTVVYTVLPMGLKVSSAEYQRIMDRIMRPVTPGWESHYINDVRTHCNFVQDHLQAQCQEG
jgi:Reverse transcriptase (RNA-dependent DNA polymerase)